MVAMAAVVLVDVVKAWFDEGGGGGVGGGLSRVAARTCLVVV